MMESVVQSGIHWLGTANAMAQAIGPILHIFIGPSLESGSFLGRESPNNFCRGTQYKRTRRNLHSLGHQRLCADETFAPHNGAVQNYRSHSYEHPVLDFTGVHDGPMPDGDPIAHLTGVFIREVQDGIVLNVGVVPDTNPVNIPAQNRPVPDAGVLSQSDISHHCGIARNKNVAAQFWGFCQESVQLLLKTLHGIMLIQTCVDNNAFGGLLERA